MWLWQNTETRGIQILIKQLYLQNWENQIYQTISANGRFFWLKINLLIINVLFVFIWVFLPPIFQISSAYFKALNADYQTFKANTQILWKSQRSRRKIILLLLGFCLLLPKIYLAYVFPPLLDEVFSYTFLIHRGFFLTAFYYPGPNNHLFFNELAYFLHWIGGNWGSGEAILALRLVSILSFGLLNFVWGLWLLSRFNFQAAIWGMLIVAFLPPMALYGFLGRGYMLQTLFSFIAAWSALKIVEKQFLTLAPFLFVSSSILGFYIIPTHFYFFTSVLVFMLLNGQFRLVILLGLLSLLGVLSIYFPVILVNGWEALGQNNWIKAIPFEMFWGSFPNYFLNCLNFLLEKGYILLIISLLFAFFSLFFSTKKSEKKIYQLILCLFCIPLFILSIQQLQPFTRIWTYLSWPLALSFILFINNAVKSLFVRNLLITSILLMLLYDYAQNFPLKYQSPDYQEFAKKCVKNNWQKIFVNADTYQVFLRYEFIKAKKEVAIITEGFSGQQAYQIIVLAKNQAFPKGFKTQKKQIVFQNAEVIVFK